MRKLLYILPFVLMACTQPAENPKTEHPSYAYDATIYELNTRQLTEEGTFAAAEAYLPMLKEAGVDIVWVMPCQLIGTLERKGTLGSYYAIRDYCAINPEHGTRADFEHFLHRAHELGLKVILDWVANHTAPDSEWTKNEGWHYRDSLGNLMVQYDWTDIAKLDYSNADMRAAMKQAMHWWMDSIGIDGFRCDVAGEIPVDFWEDAMGELRTTHPDMFTLAENEDKADSLCLKAFDMYYGWTLHRLMNEVAQGKSTVDDLWNYFAACDTLPTRAIRMNFVTNHDENSWSGTEQERMGKALDAMIVFTYVVPGMPLIYTGQLSGNHHRLEFFEKDLIDHTDDNALVLYTALNDLRHRHPALHSPELGAKMERIDCGNPAIFACRRALGDDVVVTYINMSNEVQDIIVNDELLTLGPWDYDIVE